MRARLQNIETGARNVISPRASTDGGSTGDSMPMRRPSKKMRYTQADLPFPPVRIIECLYRWRTSFLPCLLSWAGTQEDPFGTNCRLAGVSFSEEVVKIWERIYPDIPLDDSDDSMLIVLCVVCPLPCGTANSESEHGN